MQLPALQTITQQLNLQLSEERDLDQLMQKQNAYTLDTNGNVIGLNLSANQLTDEQLSFIWKLSDLQALNLGDNQLQEVEIPAAFSALRLLNISENASLTHLTFAAGLQRLEKADLSECGLQELRLPAGFQSLTTLDAQQNQLTSFIMEGKGPELELLDLSDNQLTTFSLPTALPKLGFLYLQGGNQVQDISFLQGAAALQTINLSENAVSDLSPLRGLLEKGVPFKWKKSGDGVLVEDCPLTTPPPEIVKEGGEAIARHLDRLQKSTAKEYLYEVKVLIIGKTGAGKTSLRYKLRNPDTPMPEEDESTRGIDVETISFPLENGKTFHMNVWDFEGQQISHQTHQFFLTKRSFYLFVVDQRTEKSDFDYWLQIVELLSESSPMMIFHNEKKGGICDLNLDGIRQRFGHFIQAEEFRANLEVIAKGERFQPTHLASFKTFKASLEQGLQSLPIVGIQLEASWIKVREEIEKLSKRHAHIPAEKLWQICEDKEISEEQDQRDLSQLFHDLGIFLHYQDTGGPSLLNRMVILQNDWATKAVYMVLKSEWLRNEKRGHFTLKDLRKVWEGTDYGKHAEELLELMMKFELCYRVEKSAIYIAPQLLPASPPKDYQLPEGEVALLRYSYDFMPKGMSTRLTVRLHPFIANSQKLAWKDGFVVKNYGATAEVIETYGKREIHIRAVGEFRKKLINQIAFGIDELNKTYHFSDRLQAYKLIPCNCVICAEDKNPHFFKYQELVNSKKEGWPKVPCGKTGKPADLDGLLAYVLEGNEDKNLELGRIHSKLDGILHGQQEMRRVLQSTAEQITANQKILIGLDENQVNEEKLKGYLDDIGEKLSDLADDIPKITDLPSFQKLPKPKDPTMDVKGKFKLTWTLLPKIFEDLIPFMPNIKYEKEISADLKTLTGRIIQDFKEKKIFLEPKEPPKLDEPKMDDLS